jgi:hypothetical protein
MSYEHGLAHYSSLARSDFVKRTWERPQFVRLLADALSHIFGRAKSSVTLKVVDIGAGAGEGYGLVRDAFVALDLTPRFHYLAIDSSRSMLALGEKKISSIDKVAGEVQFFADDMRSADYLSHSADLFLSVGVPYSHLREAELQEVSWRIFEAMAARPSPSVAIFDVLGRYSIEWLPLSGERVREYEMSFFSNTEKAPVFPMTFYSRDDLANALSTGIHQKLGRRIEQTRYWDRSVFVGRHTATGLYNERLPRIRSLVNALAASADATPEQITSSLSLRREDIGIGDVTLPEEIAEYLEDRRRSWNRAVELFSEERLSTTKVCEALRSAERADQASGVGAGHSLTACVYAQSEQQ